MDGEITSDSLETLLDTEDSPVVVDIRNPPAYEQAHIPDSINIPLSRLPQEVDRVSDTDHVVTVCPHGKASVRAARLVTSFEAFDGTVESLADGLEGWEGPLESSTADSHPDDEGPQEPDAPF